MTREEAIKMLKSKMDGHTDTSYEWAETVRMAIKALEQEPCEDTISRQAVNTLVDELARAISDERCCISRGRSTATIMRDFYHLPSVNPQAKTGHWIAEDMFDGNLAYRCSECSELFWIESGTPKDNEYNFCPKCGKRLVEP